MATRGIWDEGVGRSVIEQQAHLEGPLLPILHAIQAEFGHIPEPAVRVIAEVLNLSRAEVYGVVTFYHDFRQSPAGQHVLKLCRAEACQAMGGEHLVSRAEARLGVTCGNTTANKAVTLEPIYCLGLCATAPAAMLDGKLVGRLNAVRLDALLSEVGA
jgi:formate dehydrogenase subunit gamma